MRPRDDRVAGGSTWPTGFSDRSEPVREDRATLPLDRALSRPREPRPSELRQHQPRRTRLAGFRSRRTPSPASSSKADAGRGRDGGISGFGGGPAPGGRHASSAFGSMLSRQGISTPPPGDPPVGGTDPIGKALLPGFPPPPAVLLADPVPRPRSSPGKKTAFRNDG